jgi:hypothetical protein
MRDAAATIPMSDVGLKKACRRLGVPVPPRGYWNKVRAGHRMPTRPALLPLPARDGRNEFQPFAPAPLHGAALASQRRAQSESKTVEQRLSAEAKPLKPRAAKPSRQQKSRATTSALGRKRPRHRYDLVNYVLEIDRWEWDYSFGVSWSVFHRIYEVTDYPHMNVYGTVISPVMLSGRKIELTLIPDRRGTERYRETPEWIGTLRRAGRGKDLEGVLPMPADMLSPILAALLADRLHYASLEGEAMSRGNAGIRTYRIQRALADDDLPPERKP